ncbi:hypothetical protein Rhopal_005526-T1 [Rhodotorula paludigena]|uniref:Vacuolar protein sorting-associated protein 27 n=1 Tax=Rhodotorula paludigena TaxID=86838 RepID=A0AAV5GJ52_9BASI|nr:hypothetical protein Rhopal_005526-T1 [Rhodotorula paludigena]
MSFLWGPSAQQQEWDQTIDRITADTLPAGTPLDLVAALQLADLLRSAQLAPAHAAKSLVARLQHPNPNVQLLALDLCDLCIKNGGSPFLAQFARGAQEHGAATELELLAKGIRTGGGVHRDVKERALARVQDWASAFKSKDALRDSELVRVYDRLVSDKAPFPPRDPTATAAMVDSLSAPDWTDAPYCTRCRTEFSTFNRKHHCRNCGQVFDQQCSSSTAALPHYGILEPVRVCDSCAKKIREGKGASVGKEIAAQQQQQQQQREGLARSQSFGGSAAGRPAGVERSKTVGGGGSRRDQEDEDLRRAIEASLKDVEPDSLPRTDGAPSLVPPPVPAPGYNPSYASQISDAKKTGAAEDDDPDLAAAIAASLRDLQPPATAPAFARSESQDGAPLTYASMFPASANAAYLDPTPSKPTLTLPSYDLSATESATLSDFTALFASPAGHPPPHPAYLGARERRLYDESCAAQGRLGRAQEDARRRTEILREMEWKLGEAARLYGYRPPLHSHASASSASYANPNPYAAAVSPAPLPTSPAAQLDRRYQYAPPAALTGQPLPAYAVPAPAPAPPAAAAAAAAAAVSPPQQPVPPQPVQHQPQPAGFYKPSQFPSVPTGAAGALLPSVPNGALPSRAEEEEEDEEEEEEEKGRTGELIEL